MRLPKTAHTSQPLHELAPDFKMEDHWALPPSAAHGRAGLHHMTPSAAGMASGDARTTLADRCPRTYPRGRKARIVADVLAASDRPARAGGGAPTVLGDLARRAPRLLQHMAGAHAALLLRTQGRVLTSWFGSSILVLETDGRRTGNPRMTPLVYLPHGDRFAVVPANAGANRPPAWWLNLEAAGAGFIVLGGTRQRITAAIATGIEHERLWRRFCAVTPVEHYQRATRRMLPVVILTPAEAAARLRRRAPARTSRLALQAVG